MIAQMHTGLSLSLNRLPTSFEESGFFVSIDQNLIK